MLLTSLTSHFDKLSINMLLLICFARNEFFYVSHIGLTIDVILLWEIHSRKNQSTILYIYLSTSFILDYERVKIKWPWYCISFFDLRLLVTPFRIFKRIFHTNYRQLCVAVLKIIVDRKEFYDCLFINMIYFRLTCLLLVVGILTFEYECLYSDYLQDKRVQSMK
jgi:hypothetical protein